MDLCTPWFDLDDLDWNAATPAASGTVVNTIDWVFRTTGGRWPGVCRSTIRPNLPCGHMAHACSCRSRWERIDLTTWVRGPIVEIDEVRVGDTVVAADDYRLDNGRWITPHHGGALDPWPSQRLDYPDRTDDTWELTVLHARIPPPSVVGATMDLTLDMLKKGAGGRCSLPDNAVSVSENGVSITLKVAEGGLTGFPLIDTILQAAGVGVRKRRMIDPLTEPAPIRRLTP